MSFRTSALRPETRAAKIAATVLILSSCTLGFLILSRRAGSAQSQPRFLLELRSANFADLGAIPRSFTCDGAGVSPGLQWSAAPAGARSFAIVMDDPDAPFDFTHWLVFNLPPEARGLGEDASGHRALPQGSMEGTNSYGRSGYGGPCPPSNELHHYFFRLYALDIRLNLPRGANRSQVDAAIAHHIIAQGQTIGVYRRAGH